MRILLSSIIFSLLFLPCCKKKAAEPVTQYETSFKINGIAQKFVPHYCSIRPNATQPGLTDFTLVAGSADFKLTFGITIQISGDFTTGRYETNGVSYPVTADYFMDQGLSTEKDFTIDNAPGMPPPYFVVTISSITEEKIIGSFSCNYLYDRNVNESITITDGIFVAKRHN